MGLFVNCLAVVFSTVIVSCGISYFAREKNAGWRIDYFLVSNRIAKSIEDAPIYSEVTGSDHCPVGLEISL